MQPTSVWAPAASSLDSGRTSASTSTSSSTSSSAMEQSSPTSSLAEAAAAAAPRRRHRRPRPPPSLGLPLIAIAAAAAAAAATSALLLCLPLAASTAVAAPAFVMGGRWSRATAAASGLSDPIPSSSSSTTVLDVDELFASISPTRHTVHVRRRHRVWAAASTGASTEAAAACVEDPDAPTIAFPGGGIFWWWQCGAVHYIQKHFDLTKARLVGASAGALTAALAGNDVSMPKAAETALKMSMDIGLWKRPAGLLGVWGGLVRRWLDDLLPHDSAEKSRHRVQLYVNLVERRAMRYSGLPLRHERICDYSTKQDLIDTCMASVHVPLFLDGRPLTRLRNRGLAMDGSFRLPPSALDDGRGTTLVLDHYADPNLPRAGSGATEFVSLLSPEGLKAMMRAGYRYAKTLHEEGKLEILQPIARDRFGHEDMMHYPRASGASGAVAGVGGKSGTGIGTIYSGGKGAAVDAVIAAADRAAEGVMDAVGGDDDDASAEEEREEEEEEESRAGGVRARL